MADISFKNEKVTINAYLAKAESDQGIVLIHDIFGYKYDEMRRIADELAKAGFNVLLPDLFRGNPWKKGQDFSKFEEWRVLHPAERVLSDLKAAEAFMRDTTSKVGVMGFCWGGLMTFNASQLGVFDSAVDFYGSRMDVKTTNKITCPLLAIFGELDQSIPLDQVRALEAELKKQKKTAQVKIFKGCGHAFVQKREAYNEAASKEALADAINWFKETLC